MTCSRAHAHVRTGAIFNLCLLFTPRCASVYTTEKAVFHVRVDWTSPLTETFDSVPKLRRLPKGGQGISKRLMEKVDGPWGGREDGVPALIPLKGYLKKTWSLLQIISETLSLVYTMPSLLYLGRVDWKSYIWRPLLTELFAKSWDTGHYFTRWSLIRQVMWYISHKIQCQEKKCCSSSGNWIHFSIISWKLCNLTCWAFCVSFQDVWS